MAQNWPAREVSYSMRFPGHETVSIGNRVRVNAALITLTVQSLCQENLKPWHTVLTERCLSLRFSRNDLTLGY